MEKSGIFVGRPVLDSGQLGTLDSGRDAGQWTGRWTADSGQRTADSETALDSGRAILYWTGAVRDSWTVDGTEWTEALSLL